MPNPSDRRREIRLRKTRALLNNPHETAVNYAIANEREYLESAFGLVYQAYTEVGLQAPNELGIRFTKYHLLPGSKVFVAIYRPELAKPTVDRGHINDGKTIVGTLTLVLDSSFGLPVEQVCGPEIQALRDEGRRLAEVIALAVHPDFRKHNVMMYLYKVMFQYARAKQVTDICCAVTRHHIEFYRDVLLFEPLGGIMPYGPANNLEVQGHVLNIAKAFSHSKDVYTAESFDANIHDFFFGDGDAVSLNEGMPWSPELLRYFTCERTEFYRNLDHTTRDKLRQEYQRCGAPYMTPDDCEALP